jgi:hypothetical protein
MGMGMGMGMGIGMGWRLRSRSHTRYHAVPLQLHGIHGFKFHDTASNNGSVSTTASTEGEIAIQPCVRTNGRGRAESQWERTGSVDEVLANV